MQRANETVIQIRADAVQRMHGAALAVFPEEACGILLGKFQAHGAINVLQAIVLPNSAGAAEKQSRYVIAPRLLLEWERAGQGTGLAIVGFFHSHPNQPPVPSQTDTARAWPGYAYVIVSVRANEHQDGRPWVSGTAAWTYVEASASFVELSVKVEVENEGIDYVI